MPKVSQLNDATVTALSVRLGMGSAKQYLHRWWQASDGTDLSLAYDRAIAAGQRTLRIAEGNWTWSTPKDYVNGLRIIGEGDVIRSSGVGGTKITAPNGFLKNNDTTREQIVVQNLHIIGTRVASSVGIDGPFGGTIQGCKIEGFDTLIRNMSGYLAFYRECAFAIGERALTVEREIAAHVADKRVEPLDLAALDRATEGAINADRRCHPRADDVQVLHDDLLARGVVVFQEPVRRGDLRPANATAADDVALADDAQAVHVILRRAPRPVALGDAQRALAGGDGTIVGQRQVGAVARLPPAMQVLLGGPHTEADR